MVFAMYILLKVS